MPDEVDLLGRNKRNRAAVMTEAQSAHNTLVGGSVVFEEEQLERLNIEDLAAAVQTLSKCKYQMLALREQQRKLAAAAG